MASFSLSDLPIALLMAAVGFNSEAAKLTEVWPNRSNRIAFCATLLSTMLVIPSAAFLIVTTVPDLSAEAVLGVVVVSLIPGGPLSNIAAIVTGANKELNMLLTSFEMCMSALLVPIGLLLVLPRVVDSEQQFIQVPYAEQLHGISLVVVPLLFGIFMSHCVGTDMPPSTGRSVRRYVFRALLCSAFVVVIIAKVTGRAQQSLFLQVIPLLRAVSLPPEATVVAAVGFGCATVAWSIALGLLLPDQPLANRISICLEVGVRDLTFGLVIATVGLPSLSAPERAKVVVAVLLSWMTCNLGVVVCALLFCLRAGPRAGHPARGPGGPGVYVHLT